MSNTILKFIPTFCRSSLAVVSKFFRALFSHKFEDSHKAVLHLDSGGEMGLTVAAVQTLAEFAETKQVRMPPEHSSAVQVFIAADALDVEQAREAAETYLGSHMLRPDKVGMDLFISVNSTDAMFCCR